MNKVTTFAGLALAMLAAPAWGADCVVEGGASGTGAVAAYDADGTLELKWDNGNRRWSWAWYTGGGSWVGNDFNISTLSGYRAIRKMKFYTRDNWPNTGWDGFRVGIYAFTSVPGSILWPTAGGGYFFKPSGLHGHVWVEINIGWTCPSTAFVAAEEQFYNHPNCDPYAVDNNTNFLRHSWRYYQGEWSLVVFPEPYHLYRNVMIRVVVDNETLTVKPTSLGRVKALYF